MAKSLKPVSEQTIVITGASSGMGLATARRAAMMGAKVFLAARDRAALTQICAEINAKGGTADFIATDVGLEDAIERLASAAVARFGAFDTWVNVAGVGLIGQFKDISSADHRRLFETNYWGVVYGSLAAARYFRAKGKPGAIITVGSAASDIPLPFSGAYSASKFAVKAFTDVLRIELAQERLPIAVTLIKPSAVDSKFTDHGKTMLGGATAMPPPRYAPSVVADAIINAAQYHRREIAVGSPAYFGGTFAHLFPRLFDWAFAKIDPTALIDKGQPAPTVDNLNCAPAEGTERSGHRSARGFSLTTKAQTHPKTALLISVIALGASVMALRTKSTGRRG